MTQGSGPDIGKCHSCGAALTPEDYRAAACRFCGAAHAHHRRAAEKVAQVQALLGDANGNGVPDVLEGYPGAQGGVVWQNSTFVVYNQVQHQVQQATRSVVSTVVIVLVVMFSLLTLGLGAGVFFYLQTR